MSLSLTTHLEMFSSLSAHILLIRLRPLPLQCLLSSPYQMSSCRQRAGTAYRCAHGRTVMERHPVAANTDLRQHPARDCLTGTRSLPLQEADTVCCWCKRLRTLTKTKWKTRTEAELRCLLELRNFNDLSGKLPTMELGYSSLKKKGGVFFYSRFYILTHLQLRWGATNHCSDIRIFLQFDAHVVLEQMSFSFLLTQLKVEKALNFSKVYIATCYLENRPLSY